MSIPMSGPSRGEDPGGLGGFTLPKSPEIGEGAAGSGLSVVPHPFQESIGSPGWGQTGDCPLVLSLVHGLLLLHRLLLRPVTGMGHVRGWRGHGDSDKMRGHCWQEDLVWFSLSAGFIQILSSRTSPRVEGTHPCPAATPAPGHRGVLGMSPLVHHDGHREGRQGCHRLHLVGLVVLGLEEGTAQLGGKTLHGHPVFTCGTTGDSWGRPGDTGTRGTGTGLAHDRGVPG